MAAPAVGGGAGTVQQAVDQAVLRPVHDPLEQVVQQAFLQALARAADEESGIAGQPAVAEEPGPPPAPAKKEPWGRPGVDFDVAEAYMRHARPPDHPHARAHAHT